MFSIQQLLVLFSVMFGFCILGSSIYGNNDTFSVTDLSKKSIIKYSLDIDGSTLENLDKSI